MDIITFTASTNAARLVQEINPIPGRRFWDSADSALNLNSRESRRRPRQTTIECTVTQLSCLTYGVQSSTPTATLTQTSEASGPAPDNQRVSTRWVASSIGTASVTR
jgi:hypothetical protein